MRFNEALTLLFDGQKVSRPGWKNDAYLTLHPGEKLIQLVGNGGGINCWTPEPHDLFAGDWVLVRVIENLSNAGQRQLDAAYNAGVQAAITWHTNHDLETCCTHRAAFKALRGLMHATPDVAKQATDGAAGCSGASPRSIPRMGLVTDTMPEPRRRVDSTRFADGATE